MTDHTPTLERLHELLADRATQPLHGDEECELTSLLDHFPEVDPWTFDRAATTLELPSIDPHAAMPEHVRARVEACAISWLAEQRGMSVTAPDQRVRDTASAPASTRPQRRASGPEDSRWTIAPWLVAAACIAMALLAWWPAGTLDTATRYATLASASGSTRVAWTDVAEGGVGGDIVWNNTSQTGVMRFTGLTPNDRTRLQYQLWIFDGRRNEAFNAVDGGVFDVDADGEVFVPIDAKLPIFEPTLFAVTTEPPGGSVKHVGENGHRIILTATPAETGSSS